MNRDNDLRGLKCRRCSECRASAHHWINDCESLAGMSCKHCPAMGVECVACAGTGDGNDDDESCCPVCLGQAVVEVVRTEIARLDELCRVIASGKSAEAIEILERILS